jgi:hypothetical protein
MTDQHSPLPATQVRAGQCWRHLETGAFYYVVCLARLEATLADMVVYRGVKDQLVWIRPLAEFADGRFKEVRGGYLWP